MAFDGTAYDELKKKYEESVNANTASQIASAKANTQAQLKQAYVTRQQNQQKLNKTLATSGIRGGMTETASLGLANNYANQRTAIGGQLTNSLNEINQQGEANKLAYAQDIDAAKQQANENYDAEMRAAKREKEQLQYQRKEARLTAKYAKVYKVKALQKALKKAKTPLEKQVINARIAYIMQHKNNY